MALDRSDIAQEVFDALVYGGEKFDELMADVERQVAIMAIKRYEGEVGPLTLAANLLGVKRTTFMVRCQKMGIRMNGRRLADGQR